MLLAYYASKPIQYLHGMILKIVGESIHVSLRAAKEPDFTRQRSVHENQRPASNFLWKPIKLGMELHYEYVSWKIKKFPASGKFSSPYGLLRWRGFKKLQEISWNEKKLIGLMKMSQTMVNCIEITSRRLGVDFKQKRCHLGCFFQEISRNFQEISRNFVNSR